MQFMHEEDSSGREVVLLHVCNNAGQLIIRNKTPGKGELCIKRLRQIMLSIILLLLLPVVHALETDDSCNWRGSGLSMAVSEHSIQQVYLHCQGGHISWSYPRNALHITFSRGQTKEDFRLCLNIKIHGNGASIFRDATGKLVPLMPDDRPEFERNTLGSEEHLHDIFERLKVERTSPKEEHCFASADGKASVYLEAAFNPRSLKYVAAFDYKIEALPVHRHPFHHVKKECRKCEGGEILAAFCNSDFAVKARMLAVTVEKSTHETYIDVAVGRIYRQRDAIFLPGKHSRYHGLIASPTRCKVTKVDGLYLMAGQIVLGRAQLGCMAHMTAVKRVVREVFEAGISPCDLSPLLHHHHRYIE